MFTQPAFTAKPQAKSFRRGAIVGAEHCGSYEVRTAFSSYGAHDLAEAETIAARLQVSYGIYWVESIGNGWATPTFAEVLIKEIK